MFSFSDTAGAPLAAPTIAAAPARACGTCSLCCKVLDVPAMFKPAGAWCKLCDPGRGCRQHMLRPKACRDFSCLWLTDEMFGPEWKPEIAKFVMSLEYEDRCLSIHVDPKLPNAWRKAPYGPAILKLAERALAQGNVTMIVDDRKRTLLLPDREVVLGARDERFSWEIKAVREGADTRYEVLFDRAA